MALWVTAKQKIVHDFEPSNINLGIFVCSFDVCRALEPDPLFQLCYEWIVNEEYQSWLSLKENESE